MNIEEELIEHYGCEDKEDLQRYLGDFISIEMIKSFGVFCYNEALDDAVENVKTKPDVAIFQEGTYKSDVVDIASILKLKK